MIDALSSPHISSVYEVSRNNQRPRRACLQNKSGRHPTDSSSHLLVLTPTGVCCAVSPVLVLGASAAAADVDGAPPSAGDPTPDAGADLEAGAGVREADDDEVIDMDASFEICNQHQLNDFMG